MHLFYCLVIFLVSFSSVLGHYDEGSSGGHEIVDLVVPILADPRENATLSCRYRMGNDLLYSAKWFKDDQEVFRYMPGQQPPGLSFALAGVELARTPRCSPVACDLELINLVALSAGHYRCEVSTEAPTFRIVQKSANMTIAALSRKDPRIEGLAQRYSLGEEVRVNCTSDPALPAWELTWFVNDVQASFLGVEGPWLYPAGRGLWRSTLSLRLSADRAAFRDGELRLRCAAAAPESAALPGGPYRRQVTAVATLQPPAFLDKLAWPGSAAGRILSSVNLLIINFISILALRRFCTC